jgi:hypothetical protein
MKKFKEKNQILYELEQRMYSFVFRTQPREVH